MYIRIQVFAFQECTCHGREYLLTFLVVYAKVKRFRGITMGAPVIKVIHKLDLK